MTADRPQLPLRDFFAGVAEFTFETQLGIADPPLIDYITDLLTRFIRNDALYAVRDVSGARLHAVGEMLAEADARVGDARREVHRHIGDFALFWAGVYPEALRHASAREATRGDRFVDYCTQGKRAYYIASTIPSETRPEPLVLQRLSEEFELCAYGLSAARKEWERRDPGGQGQLVVVNEP
ncbi:MAG: hypothetical protein AB7O59_13285 [Pirellulales bacterium]